MKIIGLIAASIAIGLIVAFIINTTPLAHTYFGGYIVGVSLMQAYSLLANLINPV